MADQNDVTLREILELRISELEKRMQLYNAEALRAKEMAAEVAKGQREAARETTEELRVQAMKYPTREALDARTGELDRVVGRVMDRLAILETKVSNMEGRLWSFAAGITFVFAAITLALRLVGH